MEGTLGWKVVKEKCAYPIPLQPLSVEEEGVLSRLSSLYAEWSKTHECKNPSQAEEGIAHLLSKLLDSEGLDADSEQQGYLAKAALLHLWGFSLLDTLLSDPSIEEIACIGPGMPIYVYVRKQGWKKTNGYFTTVEHISHIANKIARPLGRRLTSQSPRLNAILPDGSRLHASLPPLSPGEITVRKFSSSPLGIGELMRLSCADAKAFSYLWLVMQSDSSVLVAGNTSSGKTTLLGALLEFVPASDRLLLIEETPELSVIHPHKIAMVSCDDLSIGMPELVRDSLRMRPDRVIVGEARSLDECRAWMESVLSGQARGAYGTFHAQSAHDALRRLASSGIDEHDLPSLDYIIMQRRIARYSRQERKLSEVRRMLGIYALDKSKPPSLIPLFEYSHEKDSLLPTREAAKHIPALAQKLGLSPSEAMKEWRAREKFLQGIMRKKQPFDSEFSRIQNFAYR